MKTSLTAIGLVVSAVLLGTGDAALADTLPVNNRLNNSSFNDNNATQNIDEGAFGSIGDPLNNWVITSGSAERRGANAVIDQDLDTGIDERNAFDDSFNSREFVVLGDGGGVIGGDNQSGLHSIIQHFRAPARIQARDVLDLSLNLSFDYAFDGITDALAQANAPSDSFSVSLQRLRTNGNNGPVDTIFSRTLGISDTGQFSGHMVLPLALEIGALYRLTFSLFEDNLLVVGANRQAFNSAVGLDNIRIEGSAEVAALPAPVPLPPAAFLMASAVAAVGLLGRRRAQSA